MNVLVTGATGWIGSALVPELIAHGHRVVGLARSEASEVALVAAGAVPQRGSLDDHVALASAAAASDGVIHLAFKHDDAFSGNFPAANKADRQAIEALGRALEGSDRPLVIASGFSGHSGGGLTTEASAPDTTTIAGERMLAEQLLLSLASSGVRSSSVRLAPTVHGPGDPGFVKTLVDVARRSGVSGYIGRGENHWPAVHRLDAAVLFRRALEEAPGGTVLHGVAEQGIELRALAETIGHHLEVPTAAIAPEAAAEHFGWLGAMVPLDIVVSSTGTRELLGWQPAQPGLLEDLTLGHYFDEAIA